ncbi:MAG: lamin tail domain-containing protein [Archangium sp.]
MKTTSLVSRFSLAALFSAIVSTGCTVPPPDVLEPAPAITSFTTSAGEVAIGSTVTLTWSVENATEVKIDELKLGSISGVSGNSGSVDVAITGDSLFVLTARNARGASDTAVVAVRVGAEAGDVLFTAFPETIAAGEQVTLAWSAPGSTAVTLSAAPGGAIDLGGQTTSGSVVVTPTASTMYTLTAGLRTKTATITVRPTLLSFTSSSLSADAGATVTLSWATANATRVQLTAAGRGTLADVTDAASVASGHFDDVLPAVADPGQLFAYQLTVSGPGSMVTDELVVSLNGSAAVLTFTGPKYVSQTSTAPIALNWTTRDADAVSIAVAGTIIYRAPASAVAAGSLQLPHPTADTTYVLSATSQRGGSATKSFVVDLVGQPSVTLTATPSTITAGAPVTLSWAGTDVRNVSISSSTTGPMFKLADASDTGSATGTFTFAQDSVVRIDVDNGAGLKAFATTTVTVSTPAVQLSAPAGSMRAGERVSVSWLPATTTITGLPHDDVVARTASTGFDDISSTGTPVTFVSSDGPAKFEPVGFAAPFFDRLVGDQVWIDIDGFMSFSEVGDHAWSTAALPTGKIEPYSIAPCWYDTSGFTGYWQVKNLAVGKVLIVQWGSKFQVKVFSSGQIDIEYKTSQTCSQRGIRGPRGDMGFGFTPVSVSANTGLTLFGPKVSPVNIKMSHDLPVVGTVELGGQPVGIRAELGRVIIPSDLSISEAMFSPAASVGAAGQWFELYNATSRPIDLTGWALALPDGGTGALSGMIAAHQVLVAGATTDAALNDDAGVQVALTGFATPLDAGTVALSRNGNAPNFTWTGATPGTSIVNDFGPYKFSTDTSSSVSRAQVCAPTTGFGSVGQLGTPGTAGGCGFPYVWEELRGGYFDISTTGTKAVIETLDDSTFNLPLTGAPFTYFGTAQTSANVSANGFLSFDGTNRDSQFPNAYPEATDVNAVVAIFGGDLIGMYPDSAIYFQRVGANVDPAAAAAHWIIQWNHFSHWETYDSYPTIGDHLDFQVKLFDDGSIEFHYARMASGSYTRLASGFHSVTWLENPAGTQALVVNARAYAPGISANSAFRFSPR